MLLTIEKTIKKTQQVEIKLPAFYKGPAGTFQTKICNDGTIIVVNSWGIAHYKKGSTFYNLELGKIGECVESCEKEFLNLFYASMNTIETSVQDIVPAQ